MGPTRTQPPEGIDLHYIEIAYLHTDGLICCCRSHRDISRNQRLLHIQLTLTQIQGSGVEQALIFGLAQVLASHRYLK